jgi:hypothetical protein
VAAIDMILPKTGQWFNTPIRRIEILVVLPAQVVIIQGVPDHNPIVVLIANGNSNVTKVFCIYLANYAIKR